MRRYQGRSRSTSPSARLLTLVLAGWIGFSLPARGDDASVNAVPVVTFTAGGRWSGRLALDPPSLTLDSSGFVSLLGLAPSVSDARPLWSLPLELGLRCFALAECTRRAGLAAFVGTSTASMGGLRLRF